MNSLREHGLIEALKQRIVVENRTVFGICLGMQMPRAKRRGKSRRIELRTGNRAKVPISRRSETEDPTYGLNAVNPVKGSRLLSDSEDELRLFRSFVSSSPLEFRHPVLHTDYGMDFCSSFESGNIFEYNSILRKAIVFWYGTNETVSSSLTHAEAPCHSRFAFA